MAGIITKAYNAWENKDFQNYEIRDTNSEWYKQLAQSIGYIAPKPFWVEQLGQPNLEGSQRWSGAVGFPSAPGYLKKTVTENNIANLYNDRFGGISKPYAQKETDAVKIRINKLVKDGKLDEAEKVMTEAADKGIIMDRLTIERATKRQAKGDSGVVYMFKRLPIIDKANILLKMPNDEFGTYINKAGDILHKVDTSTRQLLEDKIKQSGASLDPVKQKEYEVQQLRDKALSEDTDEARTAYEDAKFDLDELKYNDEQYQKQQEAKRQKASETKDKLSGARKGNGYQ